MLEKLLAALEKIGAGLHDLNVNLVALNNLAPSKTKTTDKTTDKPKAPDTPKSEPAATGAASVTPAPAPAPAATASITYPALAAKFLELLGRDKAAGMAVFKSFGFKKNLTEAAAEQYDAISAAIDKAMPQDAAVAEPDSLV